MRGLAFLEGRERFFCELLSNDLRLPPIIEYMSESDWGSAILPAFFVVFLVVTSHLRGGVLYNASLQDTFRSQH